MGPLFGEVWFCDTEFRGPDGDRKDPICLVARELFTGHEVRLWRDELKRLRHAPFDTGPNAVMVAYAATAELSVFQALAWPLPRNILDLYPEHLAATNGLPLDLPEELRRNPGSMLAALWIRKLVGIEGMAKQAMRELILNEPDHVLEEKRADILDYCASDVAALSRLLFDMLPSLDWPRALLRSRYMKAVAQMMWNGVPLDVPLWQTLTASWERIKRRLISEVDIHYGVYADSEFREEQFAYYLDNKANNGKGIPWPRYPSGHLMLDKDTFKSMAQIFDEIAPLHELRATVAKLRLVGLEVGQDGRNRAWLAPFGALTGRNTPSNSKFIFGSAAWMRSLIRPEPGYGLAYIDWSAQEIAIAAALSGDARMIESYLSGDPHLAFVKAIGLVPAGGTAEDYPRERELGKTVNFGMIYGMGEETLAHRLQSTRIKARGLIEAHHRLYRTYWHWIEEVVSAGLWQRKMETVFGWPMHVVASSKETTMQNYSMQANGAEKMRIAAIAATEAGIEVCAPVHDAFLIRAPLDRLEEDVAHMHELMAKASEEVTGGLRARTKAELVRSDKAPGRYVDERGVDMWKRVMRILGEER
jgi:hypothetical protein